MINLVQEAIQANHFVVIGERLLLKAVTVFDTAKERNPAMANIILAGNINQDKNISHYVVVSVGEGVTKPLNIGDRVIHISAAADQITTEFVIVHQDDIIGKF